MGFSCCGSPAGEGLFCVDAILELQKIPAKAVLVLTDGSNTLLPIGEICHNALEVIKALQVERDFLLAKQSKQHSYGPGFE